MDARTEQEVREAVERDPSLARVARALGVQVDAPCIGDRVRGRGAGYYGGRIGEVVSVDSRVTILLPTSRQGGDRTETLSVSLDHFARWWGAAR